MTVDWEMDHVGLVIKDIDKGINYFKRLGIKLLNPPELETLECINPDTRVTFRSCFIQNETLRIKLIQPASGNSLFNQYLDTYGEGINHVTFRVNNLQEERDRLTDMGIRVNATAKRPTGSDMEVFFDTRKVGNTIITLFSEPVPFPIFRPSDGKWRFHHLGYVVKDIFEFAEYYESIGFKLVAPPRQDSGGPSQEILNNWTIYGKIPIAQPNSRMGMCQLRNKQGTFGIGTNAPFGGKDLFQEFLDTRGEGIQHLHFLVDDLLRELAYMVANGFPCFITQKRPDGLLNESFYDTREVGNIIIALWGGKEPPFKMIPE